KQRIERIKISQEAADKDTENLRPHTIKGWRNNQSLRRNIISVDAEYLMFRIENSRTFRQQLRYSREHPKSAKNLFADPESAAAQPAQEEILLNMVKSTGQEFMADLSAHGQEDPAIITYDGFI